MFAVIAVQSCRGVKIYLIQFNFKFVSCLCNSSMCDVGFFIAAELGNLYDSKKTIVLSPPSSQINHNILMNPSMNVLHFIDFNHQNICLRN